MPFSLANLPPTGSSLARDMTWRILSGQLKGHADGLFRWLLRLAVAALALAAGLGVCGRLWIASRSLPDYDATLRVRGCPPRSRSCATTPMCRISSVDRSGHVFFGLGFAHAQDRLWQMTMLRRTAQGRLSEVFGERRLAIDEVLRRLDLYRLAAAIGRRCRTPIRQAALDAYSPGVNAWLDASQRRRAGRGAPEILSVPPEIAPWTAGRFHRHRQADGAELAAHLENEVLRARAALALPPERLRDILPEAPGAASPPADMPRSFPKDAPAWRRPTNRPAPFPAPGFAGRRTPGRRPQALRGGRHASGQ
jgi:penicillin amidase